MKKEMRKGKTFKQAVASWRGGSKKTKSRSTTKTRSVSNMARRRRASPKKKTFRRKAKGMLTGLVGQAVGAAAYGAVRERMSIALDPITQRVPMGQYADEAVMLTANYLLASGKVPFVNKVPFVRQVAKAGLMIEAARLGEQLVRGMSAPAASTQTSTSSGHMF